MTESAAKFVIADAGKCTACRACELACFAAHEKNAAKTVGNITTPVIPNLFVVKLKGDVLTRMPVQCHHCEDAPCLRSCVAGAITRSAEGQVIIDAKRCIGCKNCALACPFGAAGIVQADILPLASTPASARKCDLCEGRTAGPACISACPNEALRLVNMGVELHAKRAAAAEGFSTPAPAAAHAAAAPQGGK
jgi:electron transport protein HydN